MFRTKLAPPRLRATQLRRLAFDPLERRTLLSIAGTVTGPDGSEGGFTVYIDTNQNGQDDDSMSTESAADGTFEFIDLAAGTYRVSLVLPTGFGFSDPSAGFRDVFLASDSSTASDIDFQLEAATGSISGKVSASSGGIGDVTVDIDSDGDGFPSDALRTMTASDGTYEFTGLAAGTYSVLIQPPSGYVVTKNPFFGAQSVTLADANSHVTGVDFSVANGSISGIPITRPPRAVAPTSSTS